MANQSNRKRKKEGSSDFKRLKAKVGKRALKPANETDTNFEVGKLIVGKQNVARESDKAEIEEAREIYSTRGRSIDDLASHLRHPAAAARISAAKGLKDAVTRQQTTTKLIRSHLAILMPVCAKCCVDEESEVRQLALVMLSCVIAKAVGSSWNDGDEDLPKDVDGRLFLKPFMPLLMAHVISALNSLDRSTQLDGTQIVGMISKLLPTFIAAYSSEILPAFVGILSHRSSQSIALDLEPSTAASNDRKNKGRRKKSTKNSSAKNQVLQSLLFLLKSARSKRRMGAENGKQGPSQDPDLTVISGRRTANALFIPGRKSGPVPFKSIWKIEEIPNFVSLHRQSLLCSSAEQSASLRKDTICDLLGRLRDAFVEVTQNEPHDVQEIALILESTHLFYISFCRSIALDTQETDNFHRVWPQFTALIMDMFPLASKTNSSSLELDVNLQICTIILDAYVDGRMITRKHFEDVLAYLLSELENCKPTSEPNSNDIIKAQSDSALFDAIEKLLFISRDDEQFAEDTNIRVIKAIASNFFQDEACRTTRGETAVARSPAGRKCALLARGFFSQTEWSISKFGRAYSPPVLSQIAQGLVSYLVAWGSDFIFETEELITLLHNLVRRLDTTNSGNVSNEESLLISKVRSTFAYLFKFKKSGRSIFESYPTALQRRVLGLIVMLQAPTQQVLDGLGRICARSRIGDSNAVSAEVASLAIESIHTIRKTISMQAYLGFVTKGMGFADYRFGESDIGSISIQDFLRLDEGIHVSCSLLCQCGLSKILPMLQPLMKKWLETEQSSVPTSDVIQRARSAASILAECAIDFDDSSLSLFQVVPSLKKPTSEAIWTILKYLPSSHGGTASDATDGDRGALFKFLEPFLVLFQTEAQLFQNLFACAACNVEAMSATNQMNLLSAFLLITEDVRLSPVLKSCRDLVTQAKAIEAAVAGGSAERLGGRLSVMVEVHCGKSASHVTKT
jgi:hypothetical protein